MKKLFGLLLMILVTSMAMAQNTDQEIEKEIAAELEEAQKEIRAALPEIRKEIELALRELKNMEIPYVDVDELMKDIKKEMPEREEMTEWYIEFKREMEEFMEEHNEDMEEMMEELRETMEELKKDLKKRDYKQHQSNGTKI